MLVVLEKVVALLADLSRVQVVTGPHPTLGRERGLIPERKVERKKTWPPCRLLVMVGVAGEFAAELELLLKKRKLKAVNKKDNFPEIE